MRAGSALLTAVLALGSSGCFAFRDHWPASASLARPTDTRRPALVLSMDVLARGATAARPVAELPRSGLAQERVARALRTTDLFQQVVLAPAAGAWRARVLVRVDEESAPTAVELWLEDHAGAPVFQGEERAEDGDWNGDDPVPDLLRSLLRRAVAEGAFA
jgi:hypothetical protein